MQSNAQTIEQSVSFVQKDAKISLTVRFSVLFSDAGIKS